MGWLFLTWVKTVTKTWPRRYQANGKRGIKKQSNGSFINKVGRCFLNTLDPHLPIEVVSVDFGLGLKSKTSNIREIEKALRGEAVPVPEIFTYPRRTNSFNRKVQEYASMLETHTGRLLAAYGPIALANHDCAAPWQLDITLSGQKHLVTLRRRTSRKRQPTQYHKRETQPQIKNGIVEGEEIVIFYRPCAECVDFVCSTCAGNGME